ncbi:MAG TPA: peroxiredoxin family protein [Oculatellaceae cyanobacterium]|jgi:peroxiredoxin
MKNKVNVWLVLAFSAVAISIVYALSNVSPQSGATASTPEAPAVQQAGAVPAKSVETNNEIALSPDLSKTNGYKFLDLIPPGRKAPDFSAQAVNGKSIRLSSYRGKKNVVLVFYQGSFCSVCGEQLTNLQKHLSDFKKQDAEIIAISADDAAHAMQTVGEHGLSYPVVPDHSKRIIKLFGVGNVSKKGIAWPSLYIVDKQGTVRLSYASPNGHRMHSNEILPKLSQITGKAAPKLSYDG